MERLLAIVERFRLVAKVVDIRPLGEGFINDTYIVTTEGAATNYILQRKNHTIFQDVPKMMDNIYRVTQHLKAKVAAEGRDVRREVLTVVPTHEGALYYHDGENYWAVCEFIEDSVTHEVANTPHLAYMGGKGIGRFQAMLADFTEPLHEVIKGFHNIRWRFEQWDKVLSEDREERKAMLEKEISWIESRREKMLSFWMMVESGELPMRVTHNDTKLSNILFDKSDEVLCIIDLDTVMSSTALNDFGDAIRSYTNRGAEDDQNLDNVSMDLEIFRAYAEGYLSERKQTMTASEIEWLAFSALYITYEQVLRSLMDYIDGDRYYKIRYAEHNLVRTRAQYRLLESMEAQYSEMQRIVRSLIAK